MKVLITGGAGFIGSHLADRLLTDGHELIVVDNLDPFYSPELKKANIRQHLANPHYFFIEEDINNQAVLLEKLQGHAPELIIHLAAKAGVRPSIADPLSYDRVNAQGTLNILELAKKLKIKKIIFASSSSVYGSNPNVPWEETDLALSPISPYAASKIAAEAYGKTYSSLYGINFLALRFFTVFGPRQRPDLAINKFFSALFANQPVTIYGDGSTRRDYTYVSDIVQGICGAINREVHLGEFRIYNLGNSATIQLSELIAAIEKIAGKQFQLIYGPEQPGDVYQTFADVSRAQKELGFSPSTALPQGLQEFYDWLIPTAVKIK